MSKHFEHCYIHEGQLCSCGAGGPVDGPARDPWHNLPPHLREALREALEGLRDAFLDTAHPFSPALQAVWDVTDQIEAYLLAQEHSEESFGPRE